MKILMVHQSAELYGSDRSFLSICQRLERTGLHVDVLIPNHGPLLTELESLNVNVFLHDFGVLRKAELKNRPFFNGLKFVKGFFYAIDKMKSYDLVYINTIVNLNFILASIFRKKKKVIHIREMPSGLIKDVFRFSLYASRAKLIFNSNAVKSAFSLPGNVIYNGVGIDNKKSKYINNKKNVLFVGRLNDWKGADLLLESIKKIEALGLVDRVDIVGDFFDGQIHFLEQLKMIAADMKSIHVNFAGFVQDTSAFYANASVCIVPSKKPEPFGRVVIEAMANSIPVIIADHGGMGEIIDNNITGFKFKPNQVDSLASTIAFVLENTSLAREVAERALIKYQETFTEKAYQERVLEVLLSGNQYES